jgi:hypothetical protein
MQNLDRLAPLRTATAVRARLRWLPALLLCGLAACSTESEPKDASAVSGGTSGAGGQVGVTGVRERALAGFREAAGRSRAAA